MIEVRTKYTKKAFEQYYRFNVVSRGVRPIAFRFLVVLVVSLVMRLTGFAAATGMLLAIAAIAVAAYSLGEYMLAPMINAASTVKKNPAMFEKGVGFEFHEDHFADAGKSQKTRGEIKYSDLLKVCEVQDYFYIYLQPNIAFIIDKRDFTQGTPEELTELFRKALPEEKFKVHNTAR